MFIIMLLFSKLLISQNSYEFRGVIVNENNEPISNAHIRTVDNSFGNISNEDGVFIMNIKNCNTSIKISHLEYKNQTIQLNCNANLVLKIVLSENINALDEVTVVALSANQIVSRAIANLEKNYQIDSGVTYTIFSRVVEHEAKKPMVLKEFIFDMAQKHNQKTDFKILKIRGKDFSKNGEQRLEASRLIDIHVNESHIMLRYLPDFLKEKKMKKYTYTFKEKKIIDNEGYYIIEVDSDRYEKGGVIHINSEDYGISYLKQLSDGESYRTEAYKNRITESYYVKENDKWLFNYGSRTHDVCQNNSKSCVTRNQLSTVLSKTNALTIKKEEEMGSMVQMLMDYTSDFNDSYWDAYNFIPLPDWLKIEVSK